MKRWFMIAALLLLPTQASAASFTDTTHLATATQQEINEAVALGFFKDGTTFNPGRTMTRGQVALTTARAIAGDQSPQAFVLAFGLEQQVTPFLDVPMSFKTGSESERELYYASLVVKDAGAFTQPTLQASKPITRGQLAKVLVRSFDLQRGTEKVVITDVTTAEERTYTEVLASLGITRPQGTLFKPAAHVTRAQMASFLVRTSTMLNK